MSERNNNPQTNRTAPCFSIACFNITGAAAAIALGLSAANAHAELLDFEDLRPIELPTFGAAREALTPNYAYHGFNLSAVHNVHDPVWGVDNAWYYTRVLEAVQDPPYQPGLAGAFWGTQSGEYALSTAPDVQTNQSAFSFSRLDGGLFTFDGAWFTRIYSPLNQSLQLAMIGYVGDTVVYQDVQPIFFSARTFQAPPPGVAIDRLDFHTGYPGPNSTGGFYMDDFHYTLVPAPSVLAVLGGLGLFRRRAR